MKKILIGPCRSGKTYEKILPEIQNHKGRVLFVSVKDEITYLKVEHLFERMSIGSFDDAFEIAKTLISEEKNVFVQCSAADDCMWVDFLFLRTSVLDQEDVLVVIDEGFYILSNMMKSTFVVMADSKADILVTFQSPPNLEEILTDEEVFNTEEERLRFLKKWGIEFLIRKMPSE